MKIRTRQATLALALVTPVVLMVVTAQPFVAEPAAQGSGGGGMFGPLAPARAGASTFSPTAAGGGAYLLNNPWDCNASNANNTFTFSGGPPYNRVTRSSRGQAINVTAATNGAATGFSYADNSRGTGTGALQDTNSDGIYDTVVGNGMRRGTTAVNFSLALQLMDNNKDGNPDHVSVPWSEVNALGWIKGSDGCNDSEPQAWVPLADTNGDGKPDAIVFDLDGNGTADPEFYKSPPVVPAAVPSVNWSGLLLLALLLTSLAFWSLSRREGVRPA